MSSALDKLCYNYIECSNELNRQEMIKGFVLNRIVVAAISKKKMIWEALVDNNNSFLRFLDRYNQTRKRVAFRLFGQYHSLTCNALYRLRQFACQKTQRIRALAMRLCDSNLSLASMALNKLKANSSAIHN